MRKLLYVFSRPNMRSRWLTHPLNKQHKKPLAKNRKGEYKIKSGELIRVCMTSDFFLEEADAWRIQAWDIMRIRSDVKFFLLTKRPERILSCLPSDWGDGWKTS